MIKAQRDDVIKIIQNYYDIANDIISKYETFNSKQLMFILTKKNSNLIKIIEINATFKCLEIKNQLIIQCKADDKISTI